MSGARPMTTPTQALRFSRIGLGCVTFGREIDQTAAFAMMDHAFARGITHFDTAAAYGAGESERAVGAWLDARKPAPGTITVATKILPPYEPSIIQETVKQSRERLGAHGIDLLYMHRWDPTAASPAALQALDALVGDETVRALGISNVDATQLGGLIALQSSLGLAPFRAVQNNQNFAVRGVDGPLREICAAHDIAIVTYSPLGAGFLTGKHRQGVSAGSRFEIIPGHERVYFHAAAWRRLDHLERIATRTGRSQTQLALAWALRQPGIASVLVGGRSPDHIDQAFAALALDDPAALAALDAEPDPVIA